MNKALRKTAKVHWQLAFIHGTSEQEAGTACGIVAKTIHTSDDIDKVTCKRCLKFHDVRWA